MAKKNSLVKFVVGVGAIAVAGKVAYDKYVITKNKFVKEEDECKDDLIKKYNAIAEAKTIEIEDEFEGCEIKAVASKVVLDLSTAIISKDVYINFKSDVSSVVIVLPEGINAVTDIEKIASRVLNAVENNDEENDITVYIIGTSKFSAVDVVPANFYVDDADDIEDIEDEDVLAEAEAEKSAEEKVEAENPVEEKTVEEK